MAGLEAVDLLYLDDGKFLSTVVFTPPPTLMGETLTLPGIFVIAIFVISVGNFMMPTLHAKY